MVAPGPQRVKLTVFWRRRRFGAWDSSHLGQTASIMVRMHRRYTDSSQNQRKSEFRASAPGRRQDRVRSREQFLDASTTCVAAALLQRFHLLLLTRTSSTRRPKVIFGLIFLVERVAAPQSLDSARLA